MIRVVLIGAGNVAIHLARTIRKSDEFRLVQYFSRTDKNKDYFPEQLDRTHELKALKEADIYIIAVKDEAIFEIAAQLNHLNGLVVHTSGSVPLQTLSALKQSGVLYPVQTFSKDKELDWRKVPLAVETASPGDMNLLKKLASALSDQIYEINSDQRKKLHLAAVFANNFSNHMFSLAKEICEENHMDFELLKPIIAETAHKVMSHTPEEAQTGPARRNDTQVMKVQADSLGKEKKEIYQLISSSIVTRYKTKV